MDAKKIFGIDAGLYAEIMEAADCRKLFEFSLLQSDAAFELYQTHKELGIPMVEAFAFIDDLSIRFFANDEGEIEIPSDEAFRDVFELKKKDFKHCAKYNLSLEQVDSLRLELLAEDRSLDEMSPDIIAFYLKSNLPFHKFVIGLDYLLEHLDEIEYPLMFIRDAASYGVERALELHVPPDPEPFLDPTVHDQGMIDPDEAYASDEDFLRDEDEEFTTYREYCDAEDAYYAGQDSESSGALGDAGEAEDA